MEVKLSVTDMELFQKLLEEFKRFADDERVPVVVRSEYMDKMNELMEKEY